MTSASDVPMPRYTYQAQDLVTGQPITDLPLSCSSLPRTISSDASTTFTLDLGDRRIRELDPIAATEPGKVALFALRDDVPVWGGIIWGRSYRAATTSLTINASTVESYWRHRFWAVTRVYTNPGQLAIAAGMWLGVRPINGTTTWQRSDGSTVVDVDPLSGVVDSDGNAVSVNQIPFNIRGACHYDADTDVVYSGVSETQSRAITYQPGKNVYDALTELAALDNGFEWTCDPTRFSDDTLGWTLRYQSTQLGRTEDVTGLHFDYTQGLYNRQTGRYEPGLGSNIVDYELSDDATSSANHSIVTGQEDSGKVVNAVVGGLTSLRAGYPLLEIGPSYSDADQNTVNAKSIGDLAAAPLPTKLTNWTLRADGDMGFGSAQMGDRGVFAVSDLFTPRQADGSAGRYSVERIVGWTLVPEQRDQPERWQLTTNPVGQPSPRLPRAEERRLERIERSLSSVAKSSRVALTKTYGWVGSAADALIPAGASPSTPGAWTSVTDISFVRQGDYLTAYVYEQGNLDAPALVTVSWRIVTFDGTVVFQTTGYNATGASRAYRWWIQFPLDVFSFGEIVSANLQARIENYVAPQPEGGTVHVNYIVTGLPYHD